MGEEWEKIEEAPSYEVSTEHRVRNTRTGRILKPNIIGRTPTVTLMDAGFRLTRSVPKLVRDAFGPGY